MVLTNRFFVFVTAACSIFICLSSAFPQEPSIQPVPKVIKIEMQGKDYQRLLAGPPETATMRSGAVTLQPGKTVGKHSTESYEEMLVILEGEGTMILAGGKEMPLKAGSIAYCPSNTEHDVKNTGSTILRYIYVVAKAK